MRSIEFAPVATKNGRTFGSILGPTVGFFLENALSLGPLFKSRGGCTAPLILSGSVAIEYLTRNPYLLSEAQIRRYQTEQLGATATLLTMNGSTHQRVRALLGPGFAPPVLLAKTESAKRILTHAVDSVGVGDIINFESFLLPIVVRLIGECLLNCDPVGYECNLAFFHRQVVDYAFSNHYNTDAIIREDFLNAKKRVFQYVDRVEEILFSSASNALATPFLLGLNAWACSGDELATRGNVRAAILVPFIGGVDQILNSLLFAFWALINVRSDLRNNRDPAIWDAFFREVMRYFPTAPVVQGHSTCEFSFAGYHIPVSTRLVFATCVTHFDEHVYQSPLVFDIDRPIGNFNPVFFGAGAHRCPAASLAVELIKGIFLHLMRHLEFEPLQKLENPIFALHSPRPLNLCAIVTRKH
jgi:cytochrome P450